MEVKLSNSYMHKHLNVDVERTLTAEIDFCAWIWGKLLGEEKEETDNDENSQDGHAKCSFVTYL